MNPYKAGLWLYLTTIVNKAGGYAFWLIVAPLAGATATGEAAFTLAIASLITSAATLGIPTAVSRLYPATGDRRYLDTALTYHIAAAAAVAPLALWRWPTALLAAAGIIGGFYGAAYYAKLNTKPLFIATAAGHAIRIALAPLVAAAGPDAIAATYAIPSITTAVIGIREAKPAFNTRVFTEELKAGAAVWTPGLLAAAAANAGVIAVYGAAGAASAGVLYVAQVLAGAATAPAAVITGALLPYLSATERREEAAAKAAKLALATSAPLAAVLISAGPHILALLGPKYTEGAIALAIYTAAQLASIPTSTLGNLTYAQGRYATVASGGFLTNTATLAATAIIGRTPEGAAAATLFSQAVALAYYTAANRQTAREIARQAAKILPAALLGAAGALGLAGAAAGATASYAAMYKTKVLTRREAAEVAKALLPNKAYQWIAPKAARLLDALDQL